jgi:hypothetical protein
MFQFTEYFNPLTIEVITDSNPEGAKKDLLSIYENLPLVERLLGLENSYVTIKFFSLAVVMSLSTLKAKMMMGQNNDFSKNTES